MNKGLYALAGLVCVMACSRRAACFASVSWPSCPNWGGTDAVLGPRDLYTLFGLNEAERAHHVLAIGKELVRVLEAEGYRIEDNARAAHRIGFAVMPLKAGALLTVTIDSTSRRPERTASERLCVASTTAQLALRKVFSQTHFSLPVSSMDRRLHLPGPRSSCSARPANNQTSGLTTQQTIAAALGQQPAISPAQRLRISAAHIGGLDDHMGDEALARAFARLGWKPRARTEARPQSEGARGSNAGHGGRGELDASAEGCRATGSLPEKRNTC